MQRENPQAPEALDLSPLDSTVETRPVSGIPPSAVPTPPASDDAKGKPGKVPTTPRVQACGQRIFTLEEVQQHNTAESCWIIANGRVYDVTSFLGKHPAGAQTILRRGGMDCTEDWEFHSGGAQKIWKKLEIGKLDTAGGKCVIC